ncbi:hypothetical protein PZA11_000769 [Diplocarpon coronariae]|uniref:Uncharacterized protein n=1 Tax=Diplocarpon coronariae TaxID=2795749 RepID=A0A218Z218_9HELO|nr:hypothetical protein JHW43_006399 [Diplocarpon mali]OWP01998.1 hypothetical protein B2J93_4624 [Marssonina coronariae]
MHLLLALALSLASVARVSSLPAACPPPTPSSFTISRFSTFTPSGSNPTPAQVSFSYSDGAGLASSTCLLRGATETSDRPVVCVDPDISFEFTGGHGLVVWERLAGCNGTATVLRGEIYVGTYCYPSPAGVPLGLGTSCQTPSVSVGGSLVVI